MRLQQCDQSVSVYRNVKLSKRGDTSTKSFALLSDMMRIVTGRNRQLVDLPSETHNSYQYTILDSGLRDQNKAF